MGVIGLKRAENAFSADNGCKDGDVLNGFFRCFERIFIKYDKISKFAFFKAAFYFFFMELIRPQIVTAFKAL